MQFIRLILFPFSLLYGLVITIRNWCYNVGIIKSYEADVPVISVGNLDVGGAGKSPMTEYLIRLFNNVHNIATLSRGYGRKTTGFVLPTRDPQATTAAEIGDEPAQFFAKFPGITVAVCENRVAGLKHLQPNHDLIILDDAYQHRAVKPGISILLFDYRRFKFPQLLLPAGNLREPLSGRKRADIIVITKCPEGLSLDEQENILQRLRPLPNQYVFFTVIDYFPLQDMDGKPANTTITEDTTVFLLTGIANADPLVKHIKNYTTQIIHHKYPDHHRFSLKNITKLAAEFSACTSKNKLVITTEKDAQRLLEHDSLPLIKKLPFMVIPIGISFLNGAQQKFDQLVIEYVREYTKHHQLH